MLEAPFLCCFRSAESQLPVRDQKFIPPCIHFGQLLLLYQLRRNASLQKSSRVCCGLRLVSSTDTTDGPQYRVLLLPQSILDLSVRFP